MPTVVKGIMEVGWVFELAYQLMPQENEKNSLKILEETYLFENKNIMWDFLDSPPPPRSHQARQWGILLGTSPSPTPLLINSNFVFISCIPIVFLLKSYLREF